MSSIYSSVSCYSIDAANALARLQHSPSSVEIVHTPHPRWPLRRAASAASAAPHHLRLSVLDSSFNPPTLAHLALANSPPVGDAVEYDAKLLLLSVRNVDKLQKPTDATLIQRLNMMFLHAQDMDLALADSPSNVAIAVVDEPTFVGKSSALLAFLHKHLQGLNPPLSNPDVTIHLTFLQGFDTLQRLFSTQYYPSETSMLASLRHFFSAEGDNSTVVCAWRGDGRKERAFESLPLSREFVDAGRIVMLEIGERNHNLSSTKVRDLRRKGDEEWKRVVSARIASYIELQGLY